MVFKYFTGFQKQSNNCNKSRYIEINNNKKCYSYHKEVNKKNIALIQVNIKIN